MAAAIVDLDINEGDTFIMTLEFWENQDNTQPMDITTSTFKGSFQFGAVNIPMTILISSTAVNAIEARVDYSLMGDLPNKGKYDIDQFVDGDNFRVIQGDVRVSQEVTK